MSPPKFFHVGVPILGMAFYAITVIGLVIQCRGTVPRHSLGKLDLPLKLTMGLCVLQSLAGVFFLFSSGQPFALVLSQVPLLVGVYGLYATDPVMIVLYSALMFYYLPTFSSLPDTVSANICQSKFDNDDYCDEGWRTFLAFVSVCTYYISVLVGTFNIYFFSCITYGPMETVPDINKPLLGGESKDGAHGYQQASSDGAPGYQQASS